MCNGLTPHSLVIPDFAVACRRLTPGPGYLEALCQDNVRSVYEVRDNALSFIGVGRSSLSLRTLNGSPRLALNSPMARTTTWMSLYVQPVSKYLRHKSPSSPGLAWNANRTSQVTIHRSSTPSPSSGVEARHSMNVSCPIQRRTSPFALTDSRTGLCL